MEPFGTNPVQAEAALRRLFLCLLGAAISLGGIAEAQRINLIHGDFYEADRDATGCKTFRGRTQRMNWALYDGGGVRASFTVYAKSCHDGRMRQVFAFSRRQGFYEVVEVGGRFRMRLTGRYRILVISTGSYWALNNY